MRRVHVTLAAALACAPLLAPSSAEAAPFVRFATTAGLMQQPTSHYYCAVYGLAADVGTPSENVIARASYVERPALRSSGFTDQESGAFGQLGTKLTKKTKGHGLYAFFGGGRVQGFIEQGDTGIRRTFALPGPTATLEYAARFSMLDVALSHQAFVGYADKRQLEARVAWPYNFFQLNVGIAW